MSLVDWTMRIRSRSMGGEASACETIMRLPFGL